MKFLRHLLSWFTGAPSQQDGPESATPQRREVVKISPAAVRAMLEIAKKNDLIPSIRISVANVDQPEYAEYKFQFADDADPRRDYLHKALGLKVVVDKTSARYLQGATLDFETMPDGASGFKFTNPQGVAQ